MPLLKRTPAHGPLPAGILANRRLAQPALLRMLSRARRRGDPLLLVRLGPGEEAGPVAELGHQRFLEALASELRIVDLAWWEPGGVVMLLLEATPGGEAMAVLDRLRRRARLAGARPTWRTASFPEQGLTLQALLEEVRWAS